MSMLYLWHPAVSADGKVLDLILTRGDSDQIGGGADRFVGSVLDAIDISTPANKWSIKPYRCNFYSEYWMEEGWDSKWDFVWRMSVHFKESVAVEPLKLGYVGLDMIDDYSPLVESYKVEPFACLAVATFSSENQAQSAARKIAEDRELVEVRHAVKAPAPVTEVLRISGKEFEIRAEIGKGDRRFFEGAYPDMVVAMLEAGGGNVHAAEE
ncbi:MAG TPA: hypothetical protein DCZ75_19135 [Geobacter sp.]|nr:hypothetical protein [Geobacter sp.]